MRNNGQFLLSKVNLGVTEWYWETDVKKLPDIPIFTVLGERNNVTLYSSNLNTGILISSENGLSNVVMTGTTSVLRIVPNGLALWDEPVLLLTGTPCSMYFDDVMANIYADGNISNVVPANDLIFLPAQIYFGCTSKSIEYINNPIVVAGYWYCKIHPDAAVCDLIERKSTIWSDKRECQQQLVYSYCPNAKMCGQDCKGPCNAVYNDCDPSGKRFLCQYNIDAYLSEVQWWKSPLYIGFVSVIAIVAIILLIVSIVLFAK